jgi:hypothetical protein
VNLTACAYCDYLECRCDYFDALQTSTSRPTPTGQRDVGPSVSPAGEELRGTIEEDQ